MTKSILYYTYTLKSVRDKFNCLKEVFDPQSTNGKECSVAFSKLDEVISSLEKEEN